MVISHSRKFIFIHNPKAAGSSLRRALLRYACDDFFWDYISLPERGAMLFDKAHPLAADWPFFADLDRNRHYFVFGVRRNPYSRFFSAYFEHLRFLESARPKSPEWLAHDLETRMPELLRHIADAGANHATIHLVPQCEFFFDGLKFLPDMLCDFETLERDIGVIAGILGITIPLEHVNRRTSRQDFGLPPLTQDLLDAINGTYARDFDRLGYDVIGHVDDLNSLLPAPRERPKPQWQLFGRARIPQGDEH